MANIAKKYYNEEINRLTAMNSGFPLCLKCPEI